MSKSKIRTVLEMIKFEHSVFALPFALVGALLALAAELGRLGGRFSGLSSPWLARAPPP
jgi:4-hydroxybenzoate polyprenyltransferase